MHHVVGGIGAPCLHFPREQGKVPLHGSAVGEAGDEYDVIPLIGEQIMQFGLAGHIDRAVRTGGFHQEQPVALFVPCDYVGSFFACPEIDAESVHEFGVDDAMLVVGVIDVGDLTSGSESWKHLLNPLP